MNHFALSSSESDGGYTVMFFSVYMSFFLIMSLSFINLSLLKIRLTFITA